MNRFVDTFANWVVSKSHPPMPLSHVLGWGMVCLALMPVTLSISHHLDLRRQSIRSQVTHSSALPRADVDPEESTLTLPYGKDKQLTLPVNVTKCYQINKERLGPLSDDPEDRYENRASLHGSGTIYKFKYGVIVAPSTTIDPIYWSYATFRIKWDEDEAPSSA